jgi:GH25 family lysozyme M1 (1,4-beta-N-acetylmuramidase)
MAKASGSRVLRAGLAALVGALVTVAGGAVATTTPNAAAAEAQVPGMDVSGYQGNVDWPAAYKAGARFAYVKATEGTDYQNPYFAQQYNGSYKAGMVRGAYHFAQPNKSSGTAQADYFIKHGGGWTNDGKTMPPMLDIEYNPNGDKCYGLSPSAMVGWVKSFSSRIHQRTGRYPMLYTTTDWWKSCTGNSSTFGSTHPLFVARYANHVGPLPNGWKYYTLWQYSDSGKVPGDQNVFNGTMKSLLRLALGESGKATEPQSSKPKPTTSAAKPSTTQASQPPPPTTTKSSAPSTTSSAPSSSSSSASSPASVAPLSARTSSAAPSDRKVDGLVWASGNKNEDPPNKLSDSGSDQGPALAAQAEPLAPQAAPQEPVVSTTSVAPAPVAAPAPNAEAPQQKLAYTGAENTARLLVFAAALLILGIVLLVLIRHRGRRNN